MWKSVIMHLLELVVSFGLAVGVSYFFPEHRDTVVMLVGLSLAGFAKFLRANPNTPVPDYVNTNN